MRIPADLHLPDSVADVEVRPCGKGDNVAPPDQSWVSFFPDGPRVRDEVLAEPASQEQAEGEAV